MTTDISLVRWDPTLQQEIVEDYEYDGGNSSSRLFERSRIKALAGKCVLFDCSKVLQICVPVFFIYLGPSLSKYTVQAEVHALALG
jgi:hypothetical protein